MSSHLSIRRSWSSPKCCSSSDTFASEHMVTFNPNEDIDTILSRASQERTTLTAYFEANANPGDIGIEAWKYTYQESPQHFTWKVKGKKWSIRQRDPAISCMYFVPPTAGE